MGTQQVRSLRGSEALRGHPSDVAEPVELAMGDVTADGLEAEAVKEVLVADVPVAGMPVADTSHRSDPCESGVGGRGIPQRDQDSLP